jgi:hypothetical protein
LNEILILLRMEDWMTRRLDDEMTERLEDLMTGRQGDWGDWETR